MSIKINSAADDFVHEYRELDGGFEHRFIRADGTEHSDGSSDWQALSDPEVLDLWQHGGMKLRRWLEDNGFIHAEANP